MPIFAPFLTLVFLLTGCASKPFVAGEASGHNRNIAANEFSAMFSPWEGKAAFDKMYNYIAKANQDVKVTVYSWSDSDFDKAIIAAATNGANVRIVLHNALAKKPAVAEKAKNMEQMKLKGNISFKVAPRNMHEKFVLVDGEILVNSSANMSNGAKNSYSESFVFLTGPAHILQSFDNEFSVLWNSSKDILSSPKDVPEEKLPYNSAGHQHRGKDIVLYSSSMNYDYSENKAASKAYAEGKYISLKSKGGGSTPWNVRDAVIKGIDNASESIYCGFNHLNIPEIADALVRASKRGIDVKLAVDNQEFMEFRGPKVIEMTPVFVDEWKKLPGNEGKEAPVRVKFYSHYPNPSRWLLNHHKFILIDYGKKGGSEKSLLFTGSYNFSETAEHNQFDNLVTFSGKKYHTLHESFLGEFEKLWSLERKNDVPNEEIVSYYTKIKDDSLPIHHSRAVSLTWSEILNLRNQIRKMEPAFLKQINMKTSSCVGFNVKTKKLYGCADH